MFLTTVLKRLEGGTLNLVTFNINLRSIKKSYFWFPGLSSVTIATNLSRSTRDFLKLSFHNIFPYNEISKVFKVKSNFIFEISTPKYSKYQISANFSEAVWELRASEI